MKILLMGLILLYGPLFASRSEHNGPHSNRGQPASRFSQKDRRGSEREKLATYSVSAEQSEGLIGNLDQLLQSIYLINSGRKPTLPTN